MLNFSFSHISRKVLVLLGIFSVLIFAIPITVYLVQQQQEVRSHAVKATTITLSPAQADKKVGDDVNFDIVVSPGVNQINYMSLVLNYDSTKLEADEDVSKVFKLNPDTHLTILSGPNIDANTISIILSEEDATQPIISQVKVGTLTLHAIATTDNADTNITFDDTQSVVRSLGAADPSNTSVLSSTAGASVKIAAAEVSPSPSASPSPSVSPSPSPSPSVSPSPTPASESGGATSSGTAPVCSDLSIEGTNEGTAPFAVTFTATGDDSDGTISKVSFNFGDGNLEDVTESGGIGTASINAQITHTYEEAGTFTASAVLTDNDNQTSSTTSCTQQIVVNGETTQTPSPTPIPPTGPSTTVIGAGVLGIVLTALGALLFLAL